MLRQLFVNIPAHCVCQTTSEQIFEELYQFHGQDTVSNKYALAPLQAFATNQQDQEHVLLEKPHFHQLEHLRVVLERLHLLRHQHLMHHH